MAQKSTKAAQGSGSESGRRRPTFPLDQGDADALRRRTEDLRELEQGALAAQARVGASYLRCLRAAASLAQMTGDTADRHAVLNSIGRVLGTLPSLNAADLASRISTAGSTDPDNIRMRTVCYMLALRYHLTDDRVDAERAAALLVRYATHLPQWPLYDKKGRAHPQTGPDFYTEWDHNGLWGEWIYLDCEDGYWLAEAYELVLPSGLLQADNNEGAVRAMLRRHVEVSFNYGMCMFNMDPPQMRGILKLAYILNEPEWVHTCVKWLRDFYKVGFYYDGWWHEGSPSYHKQTHHGFLSCVELLQGYSDPPGFHSQDGTRFDDLDIQSELAPAFARADAVLRDVRQPDGTTMVIHDTKWPQSTWWAPPLDEVTPVLWGGMGHAVLGFGNERDSMVQASLHFSGTHNHEHYDMLQLTLFAKGHELMSETRYRPLNATNSTHAWHMKTAAHITVMVDGRDHRSRSAGTHPEDDQVTRRRPQPADAVPGVPDWKWRWRGHGDSIHDGRVQQFNTTFPDVQVVEATGERALYPVAKEFRRTLVLVKAAEGECYVVDVFRVRGGETHDYMLHGCLAEAHALNLSGVDMQAATGQLAETIEIAQRGQVDGDWQATFALEDEASAVRHFLIGAPGTELLQGTAPAMRRLGVAPFLAVRRTGGDSTFVAVHHPYSGTPLVERVEAVPISPSDGAVAVRVTLPDRVDTVVITTDEAPFSAARHSADGFISMRGRVAHVAQPRRDGEQGWLFLAGGNSLRAGSARIESALSFHGTLERTQRRDAGDDIDAFETQTELPVGDALAGEQLLVDIGGLLTQAFRITRVERIGGMSVIHTSNEPGMTITADLVKLEHFPCWGIEGKARFSIRAAAVLQGDLEAR